MRSQPHQVRVQAHQLVEQHTQPLGLRRNLQAKKLLHGQGIGRVIGHRREIVDAVGQRHDLLVKLRLAGLLDARMQIADVRGKRDDGFAVDLDDKAQHTMGRGMLWPHVDDHRLIGGRCISPVAGGVGNDIFNAGVNRGETGQFFNGGCH